MISLHSHYLFQTKNIITFPAGDRTELFNTLAANPEFNITNRNAINTNTNVTNTKNKIAVPVEKSVMKYLPYSYRKAFNFTTPVTNAKTDDSYACALRSKPNNSSFIPSNDDITWGNVFAYLLRHPLLAQHAGIIYSSEFSVEAKLSKRADGYMLILPMTAIINNSNYSLSLLVLLMAIL